MAALVHAISQRVSLSGSGAPAVVLVFGLEERSTRWLTLALRAAGVMAVHLRPDLSPGAAHAVVSAADAGVHVVSARRGMDATFLEYWQLLAEMGKARYVTVCDLGPVALDIAEAAAIATRVLEEDVHPITMPLLDDDESVIGVLDVVTGQQWFPDGSLEDPREDFVEAVEAETNVLLDETDGEVMAAVITGDVSVAAAVDAGSGAGVGWLAEHLPARSVPASCVVLPGDDPQLPLVAAGEDGLGVGAAVAVHGLDSHRVRVLSLADVLEPGLRDGLRGGEVAAARIQPPLEVGSLLVSE